MIVRQILYQGMGKAKLSHLIVFGLFFVLISGGIPQALAVLTPVTSADLPTCDTLVVPPEVDELGIAPPFPAGEVIAASDSDPFFAPCPSTDDPGIPNPVVEIVNLNPFTFTEVWYVADSPETTISNVDGSVTGPGGIGNAFHIDSIGINTPLFFESLTADGIFEPGETWRFIIQDYFNIFGLPPSAIDSIGVTSVPFPNGEPTLVLGESSGSIIAVQGAPPPPPVGGTMIPIDSTALLLAGTYSTAAWMIPVIVVAIGFAIVIARKL